MQMLRLLAFILLALAGASYSDEALRPSGPAAGGGIVSVATRPAQCQEPYCIFGIGTGLHLQHGLFANSTNASRSELRPSADGNGWYCAAPAAVHAGAAATFAPDDTLAVSKLMGSAILANAATATSSTTVVAAAGADAGAGAGGASNYGSIGSERVVRLTSTTQFASTGTLMFSPPLPHTAPAAADLALSFELLCGRGTGGEGLSISLVREADAPTYMLVDERGVADGLVVSFRPYTSGRLHVSFRGEPLLEARLDGIDPKACNRYNCGQCSERRSCDLVDDAYCVWVPWQRLCRRANADPAWPYPRGPPLEHTFRSSAFTPVRIAISAEALTVTHGGHDFASRLTVPGWAAFASSSAWRVVIGARNTIDVDDHWIKSLRVEHGALVGEGAVTAAVGGDGAACEQSYGFYAPPTISHLSISHGPLSGGTRVSVVGDGLHRNQHRHPAMCRFGRVAVPAARHGAALELECVAPAANATGPVSVEVSLNGGNDFTSLPASAFAAASASASAVASAVASATSAEATAERARWRTFTYTDAAVARVEPDVTSTRHAGPRLVLTGSGLSGGGHYRCGFGGGVRSVPAYLEPARTADGESSVVCRAPSLPIENLTSPIAPNDTLTLPVHLSLNGVDYTPSNRSITYHAPPRLHALAPSTGPATGGTRVTLHGAFAPSDKWECRFGDGAIVRATRANSSVSASASGGALVCTSPTATATRAPLDPVVLANLTFEPDEQVRCLLPLPSSMQSIAQRPTLAHVETHVPSPSAPPHVPCRPSLPVLITHRRCW